MTLSSLRLFYIENSLSITCTSGNSLIILINSWEILKCKGSVLFFHQAESYSLQSVCVMYSVFSLFSDIKPDHPAGDAMMGSNKIFIKDLLYWGHIYKHTYMSCIFSRYTYTFKNYFNLIYHTQEENHLWLRTNI